MPKKQSKDYFEEFVPINGVTHYFLHYPVNPEALVFLFLHGGPGQSESPMAYAVEDYADRNYNIVYYDQRGAGKTYLKNKKIRPNTAALKEDLLAVVCYLKDKYRKEAIGLIGHSWGSVLGSMFALEHPEHVLCYVGCGQVINLQENESLGLQKLIQAVQQAGNRRDMRTIEQLGTYPTQSFSLSEYRKMGVVRKLQRKYGLSDAIDKSMVTLYRKSPIVGVRDLLALFMGGVVNLRVMNELMRFDLRQQGRIYQVPVYYVLGEHDQLTPVELSSAYFEELTAPDKKLFWIAKAGHTPMLDNPQAYREAICTIAEGWTTKKA